MAGGPGVVRPYEDIFRPDQLIGAHHASIKTFGDRETGFYISKRYKHFDDAVLRTELDYGVAITYEVHRSRNTSEDPRNPLLWAYEECTSLIIDTKTSSADVGASAQLWLSFVEHGSLIKVEWNNTNGPHVHGSYIAVDLGEITLASLLMY